MNLDQLVASLEQVGDHGLAIELPDGSPLPAHFHITEVAHVQKDFIDCGGTRRTQSTCVLQTFVANDLDHRLNAAKLVRIIGASDELLPTRELPVELEVQGNSITTYTLEGSRVSDTSGRLVLQLSPKTTDCLARDKCGIEDSAEGVEVVAAAGGGLNFGLPGAGFSANPAAST